MIKYKSDMQTEIKERMRDGKGRVEITHILKKEELKGKARLFANIRLLPNCSVGYHAHNNEEEVFYIISGKALVKDDNKEYEVGPGDAILTGNGSSHSIENIGEQPLNFLAVILVYA